MASKSPNEIPRENKDLKEHRGQQQLLTGGRWAGDEEFPDLLLPRMACGACDVLVVLEYGNLHRLNIKNNCLSFHIRN